MQARLDFTFVGCKCKTGCGNCRCKCVKQDKRCGPACQCVACKNLQAQRLISPEEIPGSLVDILEADELEVEHDTNTVEDSDDEEYDNQPHWQQNDIDDIMDMVFG